MIKLEIQVVPIERKRMEFSQTLNSIKSDLQGHCSNIFVTIDENMVCLKIDFKSENKLNEILQCKEFRVLSGAIRLLAEKYEITIQDSGGEKKWMDIDKLRMDYLKNN